MSKFGRNLYLVTGGAGFIGSSLVRRLLSEGASVRVVDNLSTGFRSNLAEVLSRIEFLEGDLADPSVSGKAVEGVQYVFHQAGIPSVPQSIDNPGVTIRSNVTATMNLLSACAKERVKRVVFVSSSMIYGDTTALPASETDPENPASPYALSKMIGEKYLEMCCRLYGLSGVSLRCFNVFGPRQDPTSQYSGVIPRFLLAVVTGKLPVIYGDGEQSRDFVYVDNVVNANLLACEAEGVSGMSFNIGSGEGRSLNDVLRVLSSVTGQPINANYLRPRQGDTRHSLADIGRAHEILGFDVQVGFEEGLRNTFSWVRNTPDVWSKTRRASLPAEDGKQARVQEKPEIEAIRHALDQTYWNRKKAADLLKVSYKTLLYKIRLHGLDK